MKTINVVLMVAVFAVAACSDSQPESSMPDPEPEQLPHDDVAQDAFPIGVTTDGHLVYRAWTGQGLELVVMSIAGGERTVLGAIDPATTVFVSGSVVGWWEGPNSTLSYWSQPSGLRKAVATRSFSPTPRSSRAAARRRAIEASSA